MTRVLLALTIGILVGEILFLFLFPAGEDFWSAYLTAQLQTGRISQDELKAVWPYPYGFDDPAFQALMVVPLSFLGPNLALNIWTALSYLAIAAAAYLWIKNLGREQPLGMAATILLFLAWPVTLEHMFRGQITSVFLLALVGSYALGRNRQELLSGLVLSLGLLKPLLLAVVIAGVALKARWRVLLGLATGCLLLLGTSVFIASPNVEMNFQDYLTHWFLGSPYSVSLVGRLYFLPWPVQGAASVLGLLVVALWWWRTRSPTTLQAAFGYVASLLLIPHLRTYDLVVLIPVFTLLPLDRDPLAWASIILLSIAALGSLRFALLDLVTLSLILLAISLWRAQTSKAAPQ